MLIWNWAEAPAARRATVTREAESDFMVDSGRATTCLWERDERDVGERLPVDASEPYIRAALPGVCLVPRRHRLNLASYHPRPPQLLLHPGVVALPPSLLVVSPPSRTPLLVVGDRLRAVDVGVHRARNVLGRRPTVAVRDDHTLARPEGSRRVGKLFTRTPPHASSLRASSWSSSFLWGPATPLTLMAQLSQMAEFQSYNHFVDEIQSHLCAVTS